MAIIKITGKEIPRASAFATLPVNLQNSSASMVERNNQVYFNGARIPFIAKLVSNTWYLFASGAAYKAWQKVEQEKAQKQAQSSINSFESALNAQQVKSTAVSTGKIIFYLLGGIAAVVGLVWGYKQITRN